MSEKWTPAPRRRWPRVADALMSGPTDGDWDGLLRQAGLWEEAALLGEPGRLAWGERCVDRGEALTAFHSAYPEGWLSALGSGAPAAVWVVGSGGGWESPAGRVPHRELRGARVGVVGSRVLPPGYCEYAMAIGGAVATDVGGIVTGGARGADRRAAAGCAKAGGSVVHILPCGVDADDDCRLGLGGVLVSPFAPGARFTAGQALVRNRLIYAWSRRTVVVHARAMAGGTWGGATDALRRNVGQVVACVSNSAGEDAVTGDPWRENGIDGDDLGMRRLVALGADRLDMAGDWASSLGFLLRRPLISAQLDLFGEMVVRERWREWVA